MTIQHCYYCRATSGTSENKEEIPSIPYVDHEQHLLSNLPWSLLHELLPTVDRDTSIQFRKGVRSVELSVWMTYDGDPTKCGHPRWFAMACQPLFQKNEVKNMNIIAVGTGQL